jgi:hypothetical protein
VNASRTALRTVVNAYTYDAAGSILLRYAR